MGYEFLCWLYNAMPSCYISNIVTVYLIYCQLCVPFFSVLGHLTQRSANVGDECLDNC